jgi:uncharacterized protein YceH (UPF0502 family)
MLPFQQQPLQNLADVELFVLRVLDAESDVLEIAEQRHVGDFGRVRHVFSRPFSRPAHSKGTPGAGASCNDSRPGEPTGRLHSRRASAPKPPMTPTDLSLLEARVLGVLVEKQHTVPDTYPLTLLALTAGCNQKSSRDPVLSVSETDVQAALDRLKALSFIVESSGGRVMRYSHNVERVLSIPSQAVALIAVLTLRGPQTVGELRINCERLHRFADTSAVEGFLQELATRPAGALAVELPRQPGARETRWAHLLSGPPAMDTRALPESGRASTGTSAPVSDLDELRTEVAQLKADVESLKDAVARLTAQRDVSNES